MSDDSSLADFGDEADDPDGTSDTADDATAAAVVTYQWGTETTCERCGEATSRLWRPDDDAGEPDTAMVCADCKRW